MLHPKIAEKFPSREKDDNFIVVNDLKFSYEPIDVAEAIALVNSPLLTRPRSDLEAVVNPSLLSKHEDRNQILKENWQMQRDVVQMQVTALDDEPHTLTDEEKETIPLVTISIIYQAIIGVGSTEEEIVSRFLGKDSG